MKSKADIKERLLATFRVEAEEHLQAITANLVALSKDLPVADVQALIEATFREAHTLKGAARSVSLMEVEALCQGLETLLSRIKRGQVTFTPPVLTRLYEAVDGLARLLTQGQGVNAKEARELIGRLERVGMEAAEETPEVKADPEPPPSAGPVPLRFLSADTIRLSTAKVDALLLQAEDLLIPKLAAGERIQEARKLVDVVRHCRTTVNGINGRAAIPELDKALRSIEVQVRELLHRLVRDERTIAGTVDGLHEEMRRLRLTPVSAILDLFPAMVRDLAAKQGKDIEWVAQGTDLEVDRRVLEAMKDPLIHLVRNAIDHGIEPLEERAQGGKSTRGRLVVTVASLEGGRIAIRVEDDGAGIDPAQVRAAAVRTRLLTAEEAQTLSEDAARDLIFRSGVSTSPIITDVSGHGLGLAIVKERVERLEGQIRLETRVGVGTTVSMILPATIATFRGLLVRAGGQPFLVPTESVERVIRVNPDAIARLEGHTVIRFKDQLLGIARLSQILGLPEPDGEPERPGAEPCVVVRSGEARAALLVEDILGDREVLVKELRPPLVRVRNVAGAGLLGTGEVVLILRPADLLGAIREAPRPQAPPAPPEQTDRQKVILVVDDSITTRQMERNILEAAGYQVRVAADGMEAWTALKSGKFDLVVSDVDMPRMDGFELTSRVRADKKLAELPVILVTALEAREDKERGIDVGANAYMIKSSFDQSNLLEIIRRLI